MFQSISAGLTKTNAAGLTKTNAAVSAEPLPFTPVARPVANKQLSPKPTPPPWEKNLRNNWTVVRTKGRVPFYVMFTLGVIALACDFVLIVSVASWNWISHSSQAQQLIYMLTALALVLVVAPLISLVTARRVWNWLDRQLSAR